VRALGPGTPQLARAERGLAQGARTIEGAAVHPYPHVYEVSASGSPSGPVTIESGDLPAIETTPPPQFDGPPGVWSPETLLCAALADCFVLTFRGIARAARFEWLDLRCRVEGTLERLDGASQFTRYSTHVELILPGGSDVARARSLLGRAEQGCLVANSLRGVRTLETQIVTRPSSARAVG
jgi:organic hydroperoxide reductase OsmC/OhrA